MNEPLLSLLESDVKDDVDDEDDEDDSLKKKTCQYTVVMKQGTRKITKKKSEEETYLFRLLCLEDFFRDSRREREFSSFDFLYLSLDFSVRLCPDLDLLDSA